MSHRVHAEAASEAVLNARRAQGGCVGSLLRHDPIDSKPPNVVSKAAGCAGALPPRAPARPASGDRSAAAADGASPAEKPRIRGAFCAASPGAKLPRPGGYPSGPRAQGPAWARAPRACSAEPSSARPARPTSSERSSAKPSTPRGRDFISENRAAAVAARPRSASVGKRPNSVDSDGRRFSRDTANVPRYLHRVKQVVADEERAIADMMGLRKNPDGAPPGYRMLSDEERSDVLVALQAKKRQLEDEHSKLPLRVETPGQQKRVKEVEKSLSQVENDIAAYSKPRVYVLA